MSEYDGSETVYETSSADETTTVDRPDTEDVGQDAAVENTAADTATDEPADTETEARGFTFDED